MSLNKWILGKEKENKNIIEIELKKMFLKKDGTEFKNQKKHYFETILNKISRKLKIDKEIVRKTIHDLFGNSDFSKDRFDHIYYKRTYTKTEFLAEAHYWKELFKIEEEMNKIILEESKNETNSMESN